MLGEDTPGHGQSYNNVAANLHGQGKYAEAGAAVPEGPGHLAQGSWARTHPDTALSYNNVAYNLNAQGKYAEAGPLHQKALDIRRKVLGEDHPDTARATTTSRTTWTHRESTRRPGRCTRRPWTSAARSWARTTRTRP